MPGLKVHCAISKRRTKESFKELHQWMDEPYEKSDVNHRKERHAYNTKEEKQIREYWDKKLGEGWGDKAVVEWLFHMVIDNLDTAFKKARTTYRKDNAYNFFKFGLIPNSKYIFFDTQSLKEEQLHIEFKDVYGIEEE